VYEGGSGRGAISEIAGGTWRPKASEEAMGAIVWLRRQRDADATGH
jgi:hypothetical protein